MNVKMLEKTKPKDMALLYFLGCLPGGCKQDQLTKMWNMDVTEILQDLEKLSFLEVGVEKYVLTPYMISYINDQLDLSTKIDYMKRICNFYKDLLKKNYEQIGSE